MPKLELQQDTAVTNSTEPSTAPSSTPLSTGSLNHQARNEFAKDINPFGDLRNKKKKGDFDLEEETFTSAIKTVDQLVAAERALPEATPEAPSGLSVSQASVINQERELAKQLEGKVRSGDLVIDSTSGNKAAELQEVALQQAREREEAQKELEREAARREAIRAAEVQNIQVENEQTIQKKQDEKTIQEVRSMANSIAKTHFKDDPNRVITSEEFKTYLEQTAAKTNASPEMIRQIQDEFIKSYTAQREAAFKELNWVQRKYYEAKNWCSNKLDNLKDVGQNIISAGEKIVEGAAAVAKGVGVLAKGAYNLAVETDWVAVGQKALEYTGKAIVAVSDPRNWVKAGDMLLNAGVYVAKGIGNGIYAVVTDPIGSLKATGTFFKGMSESIGLTDLAKGVWATAKAPYQYIYDVARPGGGFAVANQNYMENMRIAKDGLIGGLKCAAEITGVADAYYGLKHGCNALILVGQGRHLEAGLEAAQATMHLALGGGKLLVTVGTAGVGTIANAAVGTIAKEALKQVAKQGFKEIGKEIAEKALEHGLKNGAKSIAKEVAQQSAEILGKETVDLVIKEGAGAVTKETAGQITAKIATRAGELGQQNAKEILERSGISKHLTEGAEATFKDLQHGGKELKQKLIDAGFSAKDAKKMSKASSKAFNNGTTDGEIVEALTKEATEVIKKELVPDATAHFGKAYRSQLDEALTHNPAYKESMEKIANKAGKTSKEFTDDLSEAATKAYREGLEKGMKEAVEQAIKKAMAKFRLNSSSSLGNRAGRDLEFEEKELVIDDKHISEVYAYSQGETLVEKRTEIKAEILQDKRSRIVERDGNLIRVEFYTIEGNEIITSQDVVGSLEKKLDPSNVVRHNFRQQADEQKVA